MKKNTVYIAKSLDGFISGKNGTLDWLESVPNPAQEDMGYSVFMKEIDAIVMGRNTFETVLNFDIDWPYTQHVFVLSRTLSEVPEDLRQKITILSGTPQEVLDEIHRREYFRLYIDGGVTIQRFVAENLIDEFRITTFPILLGEGAPLFGPLSEPLRLAYVRSDVYLGQLVHDVYRKIG
ncbi:dihydrofolate reductase family protein [Lewinella sp. JB7]|uniref:dihydrofolate reductase family protein n=1 Tax=Lewinella sp. JB7 TaxID=2962887 RepID=UPI0020CA035B|nr:dihydrofolate reductase family protein [Lewinella sp. JB7]MCP9236026.1 dihydrofolate reductase family protein [Lewinella sp. JB7]